VTDLLVELQRAVQGLTWPTVFVDARPEASKCDPADPRFTGAAGLVTFARWIGDVEVRAGCSRCQRWLCGATRAGDATPVLTISGHLWAEWAALAALPHAADRERSRALLDLFARGAAARILSARCRCAPDPQRRSHV
jgi:hypothetical protein